MSDERTIEASPQRRETARREGRFPRSRELAISVILVAIVAAFHFVGQNWFQNSSTALSEYLSQPVSLDTDKDVWISEGRRLLAGISWRLLPILASAFALVAVAQLIQGGFVWLPQRVRLDITRLGGGQGQSSLSRRAVQSVFGVVGFCATVTILGTGLWYFREPLVESGRRELTVALSESVEILSRVLIGVLAGSVLLSAVEYGYRIWSYYGSLRITPTEQQDEARGRNTMRVAAAGTGPERRPRRDAPGP